MPRLPHCRTLVLVSTLLILSGCETPRPATPPASSAMVTPDQRQALQGLGFVQTDEGWELSLGTGLLFDLDSDLLKAAQQAHLGRVADGLRRVGIDGLRVEGHTDNSGTPEYNLRLSDRRAQAVSRALEQAGMAVSRLRVKGHGSSKPIADNQTEAGRAQNRRVALIARSL
jgi:outer membrane protein OmpA-like peptidoglycan-associated protein